MMNLEHIQQLTKYLILLCFVLTLNLEVYVVMKRKSSRTVFLSGMKRIKKGGK